MTATGEYTEYEFDHRNRRVHATTYSAGGVILKEVGYTFDLFNRRISRGVAQSIRLGRDATG